MLEWFTSRFSAAGCGSLLDIGCGIGRHHENFAAFRYYLGLDIVRDFLTRAIANSPLPYIVGDASALQKIVLPESFDAVLWYDSVEHLPKTVAVESLKYSISVARKCVGVFTPLGFFEQRNNVWGGDAGDAQEHKSGWTQDDLLSLGFDEIEIVVSNRRAVGQVKLILAMQRKKP